MRSTFFNFLMSTDHKTDVEDHPKWNMSILQS